MADESIDIRFLLNSPEVEKESDRVQSSIRGIEKTSDSTAKAISKAFTSDILNEKDIDQKIKAQKAALKSLETDYTAFKKRVDSMAPGQAKAVATEELAAAKREIDAEKLALEQLTQVQEQYKQSTTSMRTKIRNIKEEMAGMKEGTDEYIAKMRELGDLQDRYADVSKQGQIFSDDQKNIRATTEAIQGVSGAMSAAVGVASLLGASQENLTKIQTRLQAVMAISIGVNQVAQVLNKDSYFSHLLLVRAKNLWTAAQNRLTAALWGSTTAAKALMATLTVGLSVAIGAVINLISKWQAKREEQKRQEEEAAKAQEQYYQSIANSVSKSLSEYRKLQTMWAALNGDSKKQQKFLKDHADTFKELGVKVKTVHDAENLLIQNETKFIQSMMNRARAAAAMEVAADKYKTAIEKMAELEDGVYSKDDMKQAVSEVTGNGFSEEEWAASVEDYGAAWLEGIYTKRAKAIAAARLEPIIKKAEEDADNMIANSLKYGKTAAQLLEEAGLMAPGDKDTNSDAAKKYKEAILRNMQELEKSRINILRDGKDKELRELDIRHRETLRQIEKDRQDLANASKTSGRGGLSEKEEAGFTERTQNAYAAYVREQEVIEEKHRKNLEETYRDLADVFQTEEERKRAAIQKTYNDFRQQAKTLRDGGSITGDQYTELTIKINDAETRAQLADSLEQFKTYGQRAEEITRYYTERIRELRAAGYGAEADEAELQRQEALDALNMEIANKEMEFTVWLERAQKMGMQQLQVSLKTAQMALSANNNLNDREKAVLQAKIATLQERIAKLQAEGASESSGEKANKKWKNYLKVMNEVSDTVSNIASNFDGLDETSKTALTSATNVAGGIIAMITGIQLLAITGAEAVKSVERASVILAVIGAAIQILTAIFSLSSKADKEHQEALKEIAKAKIDMQREYNKLLLEQNLLMKEAESVFGVDYIHKAVGAIDTYRKSLGFLSEAMKGEAPQMTLFERLTKDVSGSYARKMKEYQEGIYGLSSIQIKTGSYTTGSWFWKKQHDVYTSALDVYPDLLSAEGRLNVERAKTIVNTQKMSDEHKELLQYMIDLEEQAQEAEEALHDYLENTFGSLGDNVMTSIENAIRNGTDAWKEFGKEGATVLEELGRQIAYSLFFSDQFKNLQDQMKKIYGSGKDPEDIAADARDLIGSFYQGIGNDMANAQQWLEQWKESARQYGLDLYVSDSERKGTSGMLQAEMTEGTASQLVGLWNITAMEIRQVRDLTTGQLTTVGLIRDDVGNLLVQVILIEKNTRETADNTARTVEKLDDGFTRMEKRLEAIEKNTKGDSSRIK